MFSCNTNKNSSGAALRSITITVTSTLLRLHPPQILSSVLSALSVRIFGLLPFHIASASPVPQLSLDKGHAAYMPDAVQAVIRL